MNSCCLRLHGFSRRQLTGYYLASWRKDGFRYKKCGRACYRAGMNYTGRLDLPPPGINNVVP